MHALKEFFISAIASVLSLFGVHAPSPSPIIEPAPQVEQVVQNEPEAMNVGADGSVYTGGKIFYLSGSGVSASATSIGLSSFALTRPDGTSYELTTADVAGSSGAVYLTINPGHSTKQEFVSCTTVTQSGSDTSATLSGCTRGLPPIGSSYTTASTTWQTTHSGAAPVIISNSPAFYNQFAGKSNDETITGPWDFSTSPTVPTPTTGTQAVNKSYVDGGILAGAATSTESVTGISRLATKLQQASSTPTTANTPLVIQAQNATSTYNAGAAGGNGLNVVVTENDNKIDSDFLRQSDVFAWSGLNTFSAGYLATASSTHTATTSIAASSVTNNALKLNGVAYQYPSTRGASSTALLENGSGVLVWDYPYPTVQTIIPQQQFAATTTVAGTGVANTVLQLGLYSIPSRITANKLVFEVADEPGGSETYDITCWSEDGGTQVFSVTSAGITTAGQKTIALSSVVISPGNYWCGENANGTNGGGMLAYKASSNFANVSSEPVTSGTLTITAGTPPATITPTSITFDDDTALVLRFDN